MSALQEVVRPCLARIFAAGDGYDPHGDRYWGSGFFIAPGWLLTCAHVVGKGGAAVWRNERAVGVTWDGGTTAGEVVLAKPRPEHPEEDRPRWEFPDIALVHVPDATDAPCVWISDRPPSIPAPVSLHGWSHRTGDLGRRHGLAEAAAFDGKALLLSGSLPVEGVSGGPVVDRRHGAVIGMNKGRAPDEGAAVPITALRELYDLRGGRVMHTVMREHDRYHLRRFRATAGAPDWTRTQTLLRAPGAAGITPALRVHLYGRLAELPPPSGPGEVMDLVHEVKCRVLQDEFRSPIEHDPRTWREGAGLLHDLRDLHGRETSPALDLDAVLLYAAKVVRHTFVTDAGRAPAAAADPAALRDLADWVTVQAENAREPIRAEITRVLQLDDAGRPAAAPASVSLHERTTPGARADVLVEIGDPVYGDRYPWSVKLLFDGRDVSPLHGDDRGVPRSRLRESLREPLADALRRGDRGEHLAAVEALLPRQLFDEPLDSWRLAPDGDDELDFFDDHAMPLGLRRIVVVRDRRRNTREASPEWRTLWKAAARGPLSAVPLRGETETSGHAASVRRESMRATYGRLLRADDGAVPVYCGHVGSGDGFHAMAAALAAGHPLVLWRRGGQDHDDCRDFLRRAGRLLERAGSADGLHRHIRDLRIHATDPDAAPETAAEAGWAGSIAVLFDPPDRPPYGREAVGPPPTADPAV